MVPLALPESDDEGVAGNMQRKWSASPAVKVAMANDALRNTGATGALDMEEMAVTDGPLLPYITSLKTAGFKTFQARPIQKLSHKYVKDDRVIALCTQGSGANPLILVLPHNKPSQVKRMIPMKHVESVVAIIAEETQGLITKSTSFYTQILIRMVVGSGEKDFMFNMVWDMGIFF